MKRFFDLRLLFLLSACVLLSACSPKHDDSSSAVAASAATVDPVLELSKRAASGDADAKYELAGLYMKGSGVPQDDAKALTLTREAALNGNIDARFEIATLSVAGDSEYSVDQATTQLWFEDAANAYQLRASAGDYVAQERLAWMYETGHGVPKNEERAETWQIEATRNKLEKGLSVDTDDLYNLGVAYYQGDLLPADETKAAEIFQLTAAAGLDQAQYSLAIFYTSGTAVPQDHQKAFELFMKAALQGHDKAQFEVAQRYYYGYGTEQKDPARAAEWFEKSALQGNTKSQLMLGMMYGKGETPAGQDYAKAAYWLEKAKDSKDIDEFPVGKSFLGMLYYQGLGVEKDELKGLQLLQDAARLGDPTALKILAPAGEQH